MYLSNGETFCIFSGLNTSISQMNGMSQRQSRGGRAPSALGAGVGCRDGDLNPRIICRCRSLPRTAGPGRSRPFSPSLRLTSCGLSNLVTRGPRGYCERSQGLGDQLGSNAPHRLGPLLGPASALAHSLA